MNNPVDAALCARIVELEFALSEVVRIVDAAGLINLTQGVQLGPTVWLVKASEAFDRARSVIRVAAASVDGRDASKP